MSKRNILKKEDVIHLSKLASLKLTDEEVAKYQKQLEETIEYVENLNELNTDKIEATNNGIALKNIGFEDGQECERLFTKEEALKNSKNKKGNYFAVKRIL